LLREVTVEFGIPKMKPFCGSQNLQKKYGLYQESSFFNTFEVDDDCEHLRIYAKNNLLNDQSAIWRCGNQENCHEDL